MFGADGPRCFFYGCLGLSLEQLQFFALVENTVSVSESGTLGHNPTSTAAPLPSGYGKAQRSPAGAPGDAQGQEAKAALGGQGVFPATNRSRQIKTHLEPSPRVSFGSETDLIWRAALAFRGGSVAAVGARMPHVDHMRVLPG